MVVVVAVSVAVIRRADVFHTVDGAALGATLDGALAVHAEPDGPVRVRRVAGAAGVLLFAGGVDDDGVVEGACVDGKKVRARLAGAVLF